MKRISYRPTTPKVGLPNGKPVMPRMGVPPIAGEKPMRTTPGLKIKYTPTLGKPPLGVPPPGKAPMESRGILPNEPNLPKGPNDAPQRTPTPNPKGAPGPKGDPSGGRGTLPPTTPPGLGAKQRTQETLEQRAKRLQGRIDAGKGNPRTLNKRIGAINTRIAAGKVNPKNYSPKPGKMGETPDQQQKVQLDDKPETWTPDKLSELAPARGFIPSFRDVGNYSATEGKEHQLKKEKKRLKARVKANQKSDNKKPADDAGKAATESAGFQAGEPDPSTNNDPSKKDNKLKKKLRRVKRKLGRIDNANNRPQPGTPKRPFRNRGTTYQPVGFGGTMRV